MSTICVHSRPLLSSWRALLLLLSHFHVTLSQPLCTGNLAPIFCEGTILPAAWNSNSTWYLRSRLKFTPEDVLKHWNNVVDPQSQKDVKTFFQENFDSSDHGVEKTEPSDWKAQQFEDIANDDYRRFAVFLNERWRNLTRRFAKRVEQEPDRYSSLYVPNKFIIPGGHFTAFFYWDAFFISRGLLYSGMHETVLGILRNFAHLITQHGAVPNFSRVHSAARSQPPLFAAMLLSYYEVTKDIDAVRELLPAVDAEMAFWLSDQHTVNLTSVETDFLGNETTRNHTLFRYQARSDVPRSEGYAQDVEHARKAANQSEFYRATASACESGWDFSSRWETWNGDKTGGLSTLITHHLIPVDLNAFLCDAFDALTLLHRTAGNTPQYELYYRRREKLIDAVEAFLWNEEDATWYDYNLLDSSPRRRFYASNLSPLWGRCYRAASLKLPRVKQRFHDLNMTRRYPGGIPTSLTQSGEQWDYPNAWPPLVHLIVEGFERTDYAPLKAAGREIARRWLRVNYAGWKRTNYQNMFEKYDVRYADGRPGGGGEYITEHGFGWTNGVVLDLLRKYGGESATRPTDGDDNIVLADLGQLLFTRTNVVISLSCLVPLVVIVAFWLGHCRQRQKRNSKMQQQYVILKQSLDDDDDMSSVVSD